MNANPFLGVLLHALGGIAAASFYIPYKKVRRWAWESYWLVGGLFSWVVTPFVVAMLVCPGLPSTMSGALNQPSCDFHIGSVSAAGANAVPVATAPAVISNVQVFGISPTGVLVTWNTDKPATSEVEYGLTGSYGQLAKADPTPTTGHSVQVRGLSAGKPYHFRAMAADSSTMIAGSGDSTFTIRSGGNGRAVLLCYFFGLLWGVGGLTFGLSMRYLGMSLGYALALGFCAAFGTVIPPIFEGKFVGLATGTSGQTVLLGVLMCLFGIAVCGKAGVQKEGELSADAKKATISEFSFKKGVWVAIFAGVMSACMAFGIAAGKPIAQLAVLRGTPSIWQNSPVYIIIFAGGFTMNLVWCVYLNIKNRTGRDYVSGPGGLVLLNYALSALAGITWYMQFMFYGMGTTKMGKYDFSSWTIHMAFIIVFSNVWGLVFHEWKGSSKLTHRLVFAGMAVLVLSTVVVGLGNYLGLARH